MLEVVLTYPTDHGLEEIFVDGERVSFGRGSEAEYRFADDGLSRLHATIYREDDNIWIVDENSSNGTFVNGEKVGVSGTPLFDGDTIKIGHYTNIKVTVRKRAKTSEKVSKTKTITSSSVNNTKPLMVVPLLITTFAFLLIGSSVAFIGYKVWAGGNDSEIAQNTPEDNQTFDFPEDTRNDDNNSNDEKIISETNNSTTPNSLNPTGTNTTETTKTDTTNESITDSPTAKKTSNPTELLRGRTYQQLSSEEKKLYVQLKAEKVAQMIGNNSSQSIPPNAINIIKKWLDDYSVRIRNTRRDDCSGKNYTKSDMFSLLQRASKNAPFIIRAFNRQDIDPKIGLYLAMIESEHCPCLQSGTGPLGMFQFTTATGRNHGLNTRLSANPANPDERCEKEPAARAAASYMKSLTARIGTGPLSIPLAVASYNSGEGGLGSNLKKALTANESQERSFWTLVINADKLAVQFQRENIKYVPKFFAAAIIGENPKDFGIDMLPLSTYTK